MALAFINYIFKVFIKGAVAFIKRAITFIKKAVIFIKGAIIFISKESLTIKGLFKIIKIRVNRYNLR